MKNSWNKFIFDKWVPFYDKSFKLAKEDQGWRLMAFEQLDLKKGNKLLDVGCGTGLNVPFVPNTIHYKGIDISSEMIKEAKKKFPDKKFMTGDAEKLPFKNKEFDACINTFSVNILPDIPKALKEMKRVSKKVVIYDHFRSKNPLISFLQLLAKPFGYFLGINTFVDIEKELKKAGIKPKKIISLSAFDVYRMVIF